MLCERTIVTVLQAVGLCLLVGCSNQESTTPSGGAPEPVSTAAIGDYLGQESPGRVPEIFAPGVVSTGMAERDVAITPDLREIYFTRVIGEFSASAIMVTRRVGQEWSNPEVASFSGVYKDLEPAISPDGKRLFFISIRPTEGSEAAEESEDIWVVDRVEDGWSEPRKLGPPVNSEHAEFFPSVTADGTLYFTRRGDGTTENILRSRFEGGVYREPEQLGSEVNSGKTQFNACVSPDESYIVVCVWGRDDSLGSVDYYVSFRDSNDSWTGPFNLGPQINTSGGREYSPSVSPDGKYFFFMSSRTELGEEVRSEPLTAKSLEALHDAPGNGNSDIYWIGAEIIEELRPL